MLLFLHYSMAEDHEKTQGRIYIFVGKITYLIE